jgi:hypothetical protein
LGGVVDLPMGDRSSQPQSSTGTRRQTRQRETRGGIEVPFAGGVNISSQITVLQDTEQLVLYAGDGHALWV